MPRTTEGPPPAYRQLRLCSGGGGFEALPTRPAVLDLAALRGELELAGVAVVDARVMLIASLEVETTISRGGRLLFKTPNEAQARATFERLRSVLDRASRPHGAAPRSG